MLSAKWPSVRLIANQENLGFARAVNQALRLARGQAVLLLNTDAFVHPQAVNRLYQALQEAPEVGAVGPRLVYADGRLQRSCFAFPTLRSEFCRLFGLDRLFPHSRLFGAYEMTYWDQETPRDVDSLMGACLLLRRSALDQIGLLDERFFLFSEEVDLCYRLKQTGWRVRFIPAAGATHLWGGSSQPGSQKTFLELHKSRVLFFRKHYGAASARILKAVLVASGAMRGAAGWTAARVLRRPDLAHKAAAYRLLARQAPTF